MKTIFRWCLYYTYIHSTGQALLMKDAMQSPEYALDTGNADRHYSPHMRP